MPGNNGNSTALSYVFDPTASLLANKIINETHSVSGLIASNAFLIVPRVGPFYGNSVSVVNSNGQTLQNGVDYYLTHAWSQASQVTGLNVYGSITLLGTNMNGVYNVNYQTIGGEYVSNVANTIQDGLLALASEFVTVDWSTAPVSFPPIPHTADLSSMNGILPLYQGLLGIAAALRSPKQGVHYDDLVGADSIYATATMMPIVDLVNSVNLFMDSVGSSITNLLLNNRKALNATAIPEDLTHYEIPIWGNVKLKVGKYYFSPGNAPSNITFAGNDFSTQCIGVICHVSFEERLMGVNTDSVIWGAPDLNSVSVEVTCDPNYFDSRVLTYFALGI